MSRASVAGQPSKRFAADVANPDGFDAPEEGDILYKLDTYGGKFSSNRQQIRECRTRFNISLFRSIVDADDDTVAPLSSLTLHINGTKAL